ncbi:SIMPL domain-containing protein [Sphingosinicella sp. YJ22]|uniref:SIMPL domain-containing protein n=1 Tax=Sphingosinicella sp. YJ22 TaxID=1104780 RepID=UPI00140B8544|nr:SIMPL domain-containing protein [Sphingosinicella sp. YJ22]
MQILLLAVLAATIQPGLPAMPSGASNSSPVPVQPLRPGEILLEVNAVGKATQRADTAQITVTVTGTGPRQADARAAADAEVQRVRSMALAAGIGAADIDDSGAPPPMIMTVPSIPRDPAAGPPPRIERQQRSIVIRTRNVAAAEALADALREDDDARVVGPTFSVSDETPAQRRASADAIAVARAEADNYAAALGMRVERVVRVTERMGFDFMDLLMSERQRRGPSALGRLPEEDGADIPVVAYVGVDFALVPR